MPLVEIDWHPGPKQLRVFGVSGFVASAVLAAVLILLWRVALVWALVALAAGLVILACSLVSLRAARILYILLTVVAWSALFFWRSSTSCCLPPSDYSFA
jgi:hypothetical protein